MQQQELQIGSRECILFTQNVPQVLLLLPYGHHERHTIYQIAELVAHGSTAPFALLAIKIFEWERDLAPWADVPISKKSGVGDHAHDTLADIETQLLPELHRRFGHLPCVLGGYSLSALFALWASYHTTAFSAIAAASPSVWIRDWLDFARLHRPQTQHICLSLGDTEECTHNKYFAQIGNNIRSYHDILLSQMGAGRVDLAWHPGNHFADNPQRTAAALVRCAARLLA